MSDSQTVKISSLDSKIKDISDYLKSSVIDPAEKEKENIILEAQKNAAKIIEDAKKKAAEMISKAKKESEVLKQNMDSALKIAAKQSVDKLKNALEKEVLSFSVNQPVKETLKSESVIKDFILEILKHYSNIGSFAIALDENMKRSLSSYIEEQIGSMGLKGIKLSDEKLASGFAIVSENGVLRYDFTEESVIELLTEFIRPELRKALFSK